MLIARLLADRALIAARADDALAALASRSMSAELTQLASGAWQISTNGGDAAILREVIDAHVAPADVLITDPSAGAACVVYFRYGLDDDFGGMHRRTGLFRRDQADDRGDYRTSDARRTGFHLRAE